MGRKLLCAALPADDAEEVELLFRGDFRPHGTAVVGLFGADVAHVGVGDLAPHDADGSAHDLGAKERERQ